MVRSINSFSKAGDKEFLRNVGRWDRPSRSMISVFEGSLSPKTERSLSIGDLSWSFTWSVSWSVLDWQSDKSLRLSRIVWSSLCKFYTRTFTTFLLIIDNIHKAHGFCTGIAKFMGAGAVEAHSVALVEDVCFAGNVGF